MHPDQSDLGSLMLTRIIPKECILTMRSLEMTQISDPRSLVSWCIKGAHESILGKDALVPLMHHGPCDLESLILIIPKKHARSQPAARCFLFRHCFCNCWNCVLGGKVLSGDISYIHFQKTILSRDKASMMLKEALEPLIRTAGLHFSYRHKQARSVAQHP